MNDATLNPHYMSQFHLHMTAQHYFIPLRFSDSEAAIWVPSMPALQRQGSWLIEEKNEHHCQAILRSTYCEPWLPLQNMKNLKTFFAQNMEKLNNRRSISFNILHEPACNTLK